MRRRPDGSGAASRVVVCCLTSLCLLSTGMKTTLAFEQFYRTARDTGERLALVSAGGGTASGTKIITIDIDPRHRFQRIHGFGGAFTQSAATNYFRLSPGRRAEFLRAYFDPENGNGYTLGRVSVHSCDFSTGNWTYVEDGDTELKTFSLRTDEADVIPMIRDAAHVAGRPIRLMASPWSPPAWMKTNGRMINGGSLKPEFAGTWARYLVRFLQAYEKAGLRPWAITTQNETEAVTPWENCVYTGEQERDFVRDHLGPALHAAGFADVRLYVYDHNRDRLIPHCRPILDDQDAARFVTGAAYHWYVSDSFDNLRLFHDAWPDKELFFTEGCAELTKPVQEEGMHGFGVSGEVSTASPLTLDWSIGERYARSIIQDFNRWNVGFIDWNLLLDEQGGPNHVKNFCSAPVMADLRDDTLHYQSSYYYIGHFSRFIKPGAARILTNTDSDDVIATAFVNPDGSTVSVALNQTPQPCVARFSIDGETHAVDIPAHSIVTYVSSAEDPPSCQ